MGYTDSMYDDDTKPLSPMTDATTEWRHRVCELLHELRISKSVSSKDLLDAGIDPSGLVRLERCERQNIYWRHIYDLCRLYDVNPVYLVSLSETVKQSHWPEDAPDRKTWSLQIRARLRKWRRERCGTPALAKAADVSHTWIIRTESGELDGLDMVRLNRALTALDKNLQDALLY